MRRPVAVLIVALVSLLTLLIAADDASGHNTWNGGYRKLPWKADAVRSITTLPNVGVAYFAAYLWDSHSSQVMRPSACSGVQL